LSRVGTPLKEERFYSQNICGGITVLRNVARFEPHGWRTRILRRLSRFILPCCAVTFWIRVARLACLATRSTAWRLFSHIVALRALRTAKKARTRTMQRQHANTCSGLPCGKHGGLPG